MVLATSRMFLYTFQTVFLLGCIVLIIAFVCFMYDCSDDCMLLLGVVDRVQTVRFTLAIKRTSTTSKTSKTFRRTPIKASIAKDLPCCPIHDVY